jgi:hypothetical protein
LTKDFTYKTGHIHVDIKPSNICIGQNGRDLYLIDFGYSTSPLAKLPGQTGTPLFMSYHLQVIGATCIAYLNIDPTIQDDCESLAYVLMFLIAGGKKALPWGSLRNHKDIAAAKSDENIIDFLDSLVATEYEPIIPTLSNFIFISRDRTRPFTWSEHQMLYRSFESLLHYCGWVNDGCYDWLEPDNKFSISSNSQTTIISPETIFYDLNRK